MNEHCHLFLQTEAILKQKFMNCKSLYMSNKYILLFHIDHEYLPSNPGLSDFAVNLWIFCGYSGFYSHVNSRHIRLITDYKA